MDPEKNLPPPPTSLDIGTLEDAFVRRGTILLPIGGKATPVAYSTKNYQSTRDAYIKANAMPRREPVSTKPVSPDSEMGKYLGLTSAALLGVFDPEDADFVRRRTEWTAGLGRELAANCLEVELQSGGEPLGMKERVAFFGRVMNVQQGLEFANLMMNAASLEVEATLDFSGSSSSSSGGSESPSDEPGSATSEQPDEQAEA